jgi:hypothetical protein
MNRAALLFIAALISVNLAQDNVKWHPGHYFRVGQTQDLLVLLDEKAPYDKILKSPHVVGLEATIMWLIPGS